MSRPTEDELEDPAEIGHVGCLVPVVDDEPDEGDETEGNDDE